MYRFIKKNIHIVIIGLIAVTTNVYPMFQAVKDKFESIKTVNLAMDDKTHKAVSEFLEKLPTLVNQMSQQLNEALQGTKEVHTLKIIQRNLETIISEVETQELRSRHFDGQAELKAKDAGERELFLQEKVFVPLNIIRDTLDSLHKQLITEKEPDQKSQEDRKDEANKGKAAGTQNSDQATKRIAVQKIMKALEQMLTAISPSFDINKANMPIAYITLPALQDYLLNFKKTLDETIDQFRRNSVGGGLYELLENNIQRLTDGLHDVVGEFSRTFSADLKEVIGFPQVLKFRKQLVETIVNQNKLPQNEIRKTLNGIKFEMFNFIQTIQQGNLHNALVTFSGALDEAVKKLDKQMSFDDIKKLLLDLDKQLQDILQSRSGLTGVLDTVVDQMKEKLNQVVDRFNEKTNATIETNVPKTIKKSMYYIPFTATATLSALWLTYQWFNNQITRTTMIKGSSVFLASLAALPLVDKVVDYCYPTAPRR